MELQAFIPAAGLGTRLRPLTDHQPKALVSIGGKALLSHVTERLMDIGVRHFVINIHHFAEQIMEYVERQRWDANICFSDEREQLLDTGGGLKQALSMCSGRGPILVHNVDVISAIDLNLLVEQHLRQQSLVTLAVSRRDSSRQLLFDRHQQLVGWCNRARGEVIRSRKAASYSEWAYSGIAVVEKRLEELLPDTPPAYPIIPEYIRLSNEHTISKFQHESNIWADVGRIETLQALEQRCALFDLSTTNDANCMLRKKASE